MAHALTPPLLNLKKILADTSVLCVYGVGDGSLYSSVKSWLRAHNDHYVIFVEDDEHLFLQAKQLSLFKDPQVRLLYYASGDQGIFSTIAWEFLFLKMTYLPCSDPQADEFFKQLDHFQHAATLLASDWRDMGEKVLSNLIGNMRLLSSSILGESLKNAFRGIPAIICGAGPSLDKAIPQLAHLKDRALILAAGTAASALNAQGIIPHLYAYVDPNPPRDRFLRQKVFETPCLYQSRFSSELLSLVHGQRIWLAGTGNYPIEEWLEAACGIEMKRCESGWTVATFGVYAALHLGCNPIVLAGMDFCCTPDAIYAANLRGEENREQLIAFQDESGKTWHSKRDWLMSAEWIASTAAAHPERRWINVSDGIPIKGIEREDLADALSSFDSSYDIDGHLFTALSQSVLIAVEDGKTQKAIAELKNSFEKCGLYCDKLLSLWEKTFPHSPESSAEYALIEVELDTEIGAHYFLSSLWEMWKHPILRNESHPFGKHLHRILFYKKAIDAAIKVLS